MSRFIIFLAAIVSVCAGCARTGRDTAFYQENGSLKPIVAVLPTIDSCKQEYSVKWDVAHELTEEIRRRIFDSPKLYLLRESGSLEIAHQLNEPNPTQLTKNVAEHLGPAEFVVVTELIDQHEVSYGFPKKRPPLDEIGAILSMAMRVRVLDLRGAEPKVILQEVITRDHSFDKSSFNTDYVKAHWGTEAFERTPMGLAHAKLVREVVSRIEGYVGANRG